MVDVVYDLLVGRTRDGLHRIDGGLHPGLACRIGRIFQPGIACRLLLVEHGGRQCGVGTVQEGRIEIDLDHASLLGQGHDHLVGHVAGMVAQGPAAGMGRHDRSLRILEHVPEGGIGDVRDVDDHSEPVHLGHHFPAEWAQAAPAGLRRSAGVADLVAAGVGQGHIGDAHPVEHPQQGQVLLDRGAVLHAHEDRNQAAFRIAAGLGRRLGEGHLVGVLFHGVIDIGHEFQGPARRLVGTQRVGSIDGEERTVHAALLHPGEVDLGDGKTAGGATLFDPPAEISSFGEHQRSVAVGIKQEYHEGICLKRLFHSLAHDLEEHDGRGDRHVERAGLPHHGDAGTDRTEAEHRFGDAGSF